MPFIAFGKTTETFCGFQVEPSARRKLSLSRSPLKLLCLDPTLSGCFLKVPSHCSHSPKNMTGQSFNRTEEFTTITRRFIKNTLYAPLPFLMSLTLLPDGSHKHRYAWAQIRKQPRPPVGGEGAMRRTMRS